MRDDVIGSFGWYSQVIEGCRVEKGVILGKFYVLVTLQLDVRYNHRF